MLNPQTLFYYLYAGGTPPPQPPQTYFQAQYTIQPGAVEAWLPHTLETAVIAPAFTPSWNTNVMPVELSVDKIRVRFSVPAPQVAANVDYSIARGSPVTVSPAATTATVTHNLNDITAVLLFSANWNTTIRVSAKGVSGQTVNFSVPAPAGALLYYGQHDDASDIVSNETVTAGAASHKFLHNAGRSFLPVFFAPGWNTTYRWQSKTDPNETVVRFSNPPSGPSTLGARIKAVGNMVAS